MAIYVKCSSCGEIFNELLNSKCPNCGCEEVIKMHYENDELVEGNCLETSTKSYCYEEQSKDSGKQSLSHDDNEHTPITTLLFTEVPPLFSSIYQHLCKTDKKIEYGKMILIFIVELFIGIAFSAIGYIISLRFEERAHVLGISSRGGSKGGTMFMFMGVAAIAHSFYSLVKYTSLFFIGKMEVQKSEQWIKLVLFFIEFFLGAIFITVAVFIDLNSSKDKDITGVLLLLGAGLVIGSVWSLSKYLIKKHKDNKN